MRHPCGCARARLAPCGGPRTKLADAHPETVTGWNRPNAVAFAPNGHIVLGGAFEDELGFADQAPVGLGGQEAFVAALAMG